MYKNKVKLSEKFKRLWDHTGTVWTKTPLIVDVIFLICDPRSNKSKCGFSFVRRDLPKQWRLNEVH